MAENIDVNVNVNSSQAQRNLENLDKQVAGVTAGFSKLRAALGTIAFGSIINNALNFASGMVDVSKSTDIALESVLGFSRAVQANGGSISDAQTALQRFNITIAEAADGSAGAQQAFQKVNISLNDLRNLSQQDLLQKTIQGLAKIKDASERARVANELLGKSFRGIDVLGLANDYAKAVEESRKYSGAIRTADQVQQNLETSVTNLQIALLAVLKPIGDLAKSITTNINQLQRWISAILAFAEVLATFFLIGRILTLLKNFGAGVYALVKAIKDGGAALQFLNRWFGATLTNIGKVIPKVIELSKEKSHLGFIAVQAASKLKKVVEGLAAGATAIAGAILGVLGLTQAWEKFKQITEQQNLDEIVDYIDQLNESSTEAWMVAQENARAQREVAEALIKEKNAIVEVTAAYKRTNAEQIANINLQRLSIDMSRDEVEVMNAVDEVIKRNEESIKRLKDQRANLASDSPLIPAINREIKILEDSLETDKRLTAEAVRNLQVRQLEQEKLNLVIEQTNVALSQGQSLQALQDQLSLVGQFGEELENNLVRLDVQRELDSTLNQLAVRALELEQQRVQLGKERYQQEMNNLLALTDAAYKYADARLEAEQKILEAQRATQENAKLGVEQAMSDIAKQFEPYEMAQEAIRQGWNSIGSAIDRFVETGKFKFSDFARSVIQDLTKMIAKALIFKAIQEALGAIFPGLKIPGLTGKAAGGPVQGNTPYIVGERGPELFVPKQSGTVVPNNQLNGSGSAGNAPVTNNYNTYNISALDAKSVAQLFAENRKAIFGANKMAEREMSYAGVR